MAIIPTVNDLSAHGVYDISKLRHDFLRSGNSFPGGEDEAVLDGTESMAVDGSAVAVPFGWGPDDTPERWVVLGFNVFVADGNANFNASRFGEIATLANGVLVQVNRQSTTTVQTFDTVVSNGGWGDLAGDDILITPLTAAIDCLLAVVKFPGPPFFCLDGSLGDVLQVTIQDDLTNLDAFQIYAWGYLL